jgi:hypothetical protein
MAAAASLMLLVGTAGGFIAHSVVDGKSVRGNEPVAAPVVPPGVTQASLVDSKAILALVREELAKASREETGRLTPVNNTSARPVQFDPATEARLLTRVEELVNASQQRQQLQVYDYLWKVAQEDEVRRRDTGKRFTQLGAQVEQLQAVVAQLVQQQGKGQ